MENVEYAVKKKVERSWKVPGKLKFKYDFKKCSAITSKIKIFNLCNEKKVVSVKNIFFKKN